MGTFHCIAVDMGAGSIRILHGSLNNNRIVYDEAYRFTNKISVINDEEKWDIEAIYSEILKGINLALKKYPEPVSIGVDSWGVDYVLLDNNGQLIEVPYAYRDKRTTGMHGRWREKLSDRETFQETGINFYPFNTLFQLLASEEGGAVKQCAHILFIPCYIYYRLTGEMKNELTISSTSQLVEAGSEDFSNRILDLLGINRKLFGAMARPGEIIGGISEQKIHQGHLKGVSVCCHDTASAVAAIPSDTSEFAFISTGTWCVLGTEALNPVLTEEALQFGFTNERGYNNTFRVLKNIVGLWLVQGIKSELPQVSGYAELEKMAVTSQPATHIVDPDDELFYSPQSMIGAFDQYFDKTRQKKPGQISQYIQCAYRSLALSFAYYMNKLEFLTGKNYQQLHLIGGGSQSAFLCQSTADYTGKEVVAGPIECAALGNIVVQAIAMKKIEDLRSGRQLIRRSFPVVKYISDIPVQDRKGAYKKFIQLKNNHYVKE